jgi:hypothetical protein
MKIQIVTFFSVFSEDVKTPGHFSEKKTPDVSRGHPIMPLSRKIEVTVNSISYH